MFKKNRDLLLLIVALWLAGGASTPSVRAAGVSLLMWPMTPVVTADSRATALWLENRGADPVALQIRVLRWHQIQYTDAYQEQTGVVASPPAVTIPPGERQLIRLTRTSEPEVNGESAYRVLIDELPIAVAAVEHASPASPLIGIKVRMRYSLPLFVYGVGALRQPASSGDDIDGLQWRVAELDGRRWLVVRNDGRTYRRISQVAISTPGGRWTIADGLLGYVLAGAEMRWLLPDASPLRPGMTLEAWIDGTAITASTG